MEFKRVEVSRARARAAEQAEEPAEAPQAEPSRPALLHQGALRELSAAAFAGRPPVSDLANEADFEGVYVAHWEASRFVVDAGRGPFGLWRRVEKWATQFPPDFAGVAPPERRSNPRYFRMRVRGTIGPKGAYGHRGICSRQLQVSEVLACEETSTPGRTW